MSWSSQVSLSLSSSSGPTVDLTLVLLSEYAPSYHGKVVQNTLGLQLGLGLVNAFLETKRCRYACLILALRLHASLFEWGGVDPI